MNQVKGWDLECNRYYCRYYCSNGTNAMHGRKPSWRIHRRTMIAEEKFHTSGDTDNTPTDRRWWDPLHHYPPPPFFYFQPHHVPQASWAAFFIFPYGSPALLSVTHHGCHMVSAL